MGGRILSSSSSCFTCAILVATLATNVSAQEPKLGLEVLANKAELIVQGKVTARQSEWNADQTRIYTRVTITVEQYIKGQQVEQTVVVTHLGGEVGDVGEVYGGAVRFDENEEVLVFLNKDQQGRLRVTGNAQGKYSITRDRATGERMVGENRPLRDLKAEIERIVK